MSDPIDPGPRRAAGAGALPAGSAPSSRPAGSVLDLVEDLGAKVVAEAEEAVGGPLYPIHGYVEPVPVGGPGGHGGAVFYRCAWPTAMVFPERQPVVWRLKGLGVTDVLNLCVERDDHDEVLRTGMRSHRIPIHDGDIPTDAQADEIMRLAYEIVADPPRKLAIHCEAGVGRTGCVVALILVCLYGMEAAKALEDADRHGHLMPLQRRWIATLKP